MSYIHIFTCTRQHVKTEKVKGKQGLSNKLGQRKTKHLSSKKIAKGS